MAGFVVGFTTGVIGSVLQGASLGDALESGLNSGAVAGVLAGLGRASVGVKVRKLRDEHWRDRFDEIALAKQAGFTPGEEIAATDINLKRAQEAWFPDAPMEYVKKFTTENVPSEMQSLMDSNGVAGATPALKRGGVFTGKSNVYFNKNLAFTSAKELFYTMAHEFIHVSQHALLKGIVATSINSKLFSYVKT